MPSSTRRSSRHSGTQARRSTSDRTSRAEVRRDGAGDVIEEEERAPADEEENDGAGEGPGSAADPESQPNGGEDGDDSNAGPPELLKPQPPEPQPLDEGAASMLGPVMNTWKDHISQMGNIKKYIEESSVTTALYKDACPVLGEDEGVLDRLDEGYKQLIDAQEESKVRKEVLSEIAQAVLRGDAIMDAVSLYESSVKEKLSAYEKQTARQRYSKNETYAAYREAVWENTSDDPMPPLRDLITAEEGDDGSDDEDFVVGGMRQDFRCPLSMTTLVDPVTAARCKHSYSRDVVNEYIASQRRRGEVARCPVAGCANKLTQDTLTVNAALAKRVKAHIRREEMRGESNRKTRPTQVLD